MRVFLTGATGFIGSRILPLLLEAGHEVVGVARSADGLKAVAAAGAEPYEATLEDAPALARGGESADAVIHTAFDHDFSRFLDNCEKDRRVIGAFADVLSGSSRPFLVTSGVGMGSAQPGALATEAHFDRDNPNPRRLSELAGEAALERGVSVATVRLPQVHDTRRQGLITPMIEMARARGFVAYAGDGSTRWSAAHVSDVARLYVAALARHEAGARYHAVAEDGVTMRVICDTIGEALGLPVRALADNEVADYFGPLAHFATLDLPASSQWTRDALDWQPTGPTLREDLAQLGTDS